MIMSSSSSSFPKILCSLLLLLLSSSYNVVHGQKCVNKTGLIVNRERRVTNTDQLREYYLCPGIYNIGNLDPINMNIDRATGQWPLPLRQNMKVKCWPNGLQTDGCILRGGTRQVDGTGLPPFNEWIPPSESVDGVELYGLTFENPLFGLSVDIKKPGRISFIDCAFINNRKSMGPILLDYYNPNPNMTGVEEDIFGDGPLTNELETTFEMCNFTENKYFGTPALPALITNNGPQNTLIVKSSIFMGNNMKQNNTMMATNSFLIDSTGPTVLENNCFFDNNLGVSPVVNFGSTLDIGNGNFGDQKSNGDKCDFVSTFTSQEQVDANNPDCLKFSDAVFECGLLTPPPTRSPQPSASPTISPKPSPAPTATHVPTWGFALKPSALTPPPPTNAPPPPTFPPPTQPPTLSPITPLPTLPPPPTLPPTIAVAPTTTPVVQPSIVPTITISASPTVEASSTPTVTPTPPPTTENTVSETISGLTMILSGIDTSSTPAITRADGDVLGQVEIESFERATGDYTTNYYDDNVMSSINIIKSYVNVTNQQVVVSGTRRHLDSGDDGDVEITYMQHIMYENNGDVTSLEVLTMPLSTEEDIDEYIAFLKDEGTKSGTLVYNDLTNVKLGGTFTEGQPTSYPTKKPTPLPTEAEVTPTTQQPTPAPDPTTSSSAVSAFTTTLSKYALLMFVVVSMML